MSKFFAKSSLIVQIKKKTMIDRLLNSSSEIKAERTAREELGRLIDEGLTDPLLD